MGLDLLLIFLGLAVALFVRWLYRRVREDDRELFGD